MLRGGREGNDKNRSGLSISMNIYLFTCFSFDQLCSVQLCISFTKITYLIWLEIYGRKGTERYTVRSVWS